MSYNPDYVKQERDRAQLLELQIQRCKTRRVEQEGRDRQNLKGVDNKFVMKCEPHQFSGGHHRTVVRPAAIGGGISGGGTSDDSTSRTLLSELLQAKIKNLQENKEFAKGVMEGAPVPMEETEEGRRRDESKLNLVLYLTQLQDNLEAGYISDLFYDTLRRAVIEMVRGAADLKANDIEDLMGGIQGFIDKLNEYLAEGSFPVNRQRILQASRNFLTRVKIFLAGLLRIAGRPLEERRQVIRGLMKELKLSGNFSKKDFDVLPEDVKQLIQEERENWAQMLDDEDLMDTWMDAHTELNRRMIDETGVDIEGNVLDDAEDDGEGSESAPSDVASDETVTTEVVIPTTRAELDGMYTSIADLRRLAEELDYRPRPGTNRNAIRKRIISLLNL